MASQQQQRLKKELLAQRARAEALRHLESTGSGPSQGELARQQQERRSLQSATAARVERFIGSGTSSSATSAAAFDPRVRDNTLHALARRRAEELQQQKQAQLPRGRRGGALPDGWTEVRDPASGEAYYWNEVRCSVIVRKRRKTAGADVWTMAHDVQRTNETSWERPGRRTRGEEVRSRLAGAGRVVLVMTRRLRLTWCLCVFVCCAFGSQTGDAAIEAGSSLGTAGVAAAAAEENDLPAYEHSSRRS